MQKGTGDGRPPRHPRPSLPGVPACLELVLIADAFGALASAVRDAQRDDPFSPVRVLVDNADAATPLRRRLARAARAEGRRGLAAVSVTTLGAYASEFAHAPLAAAGRRRLSRAALAEALRRALIDTPSTFAPVATHAATIDELVGAYEELRFVDPTRAGRLNGAGRRAADVQRLCDAARAALAAGFYDDVDLLEVAARQAQGVRGLATVVSFLPERLRPVEAAFFYAVGARVLLALTGDVVADVPVRALVEAGTAAGLPTAPGASFVALTEDPLAAATPLDFDELIESPDPVGAARAAIGEILTALGRGVAARRCAVVTPRRDAQLDLVRRVAASIDAPAKAGDGALLSWRTRGGRSLATTRGAMVLTELLECARAGTLERMRVVSLLDAVRALPPLAALPPVARAERCSRRAGIVAGDAARWHAQLDALVEADPEARGDATLLVEATRAIEARARAVQGCRSWSEFAAWCRDVLAASLPPDLELPPEERRALDVLETVLAGLVELDQVGGNPELVGFVEAFARAIELPLPHLGASGDGVLVGDLDDVRGGDFDVVVVVGLQEGALPARPARSAILDDGARTAAGLPTQGAFDALARDRRRLALACAAAVRRVGVVAAADMGGRHLYPSRFVDPTAPRHRHPGLAAGLAQAGATEAWSVNDLACAPLAATAGAGEPAAMSAVAARLGLGARVAAAVARAHAEVGSHTGVVDATDVAAALADRPLSATSLEAYAACPFRYFAANLLGCEADDEPETRIAIDPRDRGLLVHRILQRFVAEQIATDPENPSVGSAERLAAISEEEFARLRRSGRAGKEILFDAECRAIREWLEEERRHDATLRARGRRPVAVELAFGAEGMPVLERAGEGVPLRFAGRIDRVDFGPGEELHVVDYKTVRRAASYGNVVKDPVDRGRRLQLPLYALAARALFPAPITRPVSACYRLIGDEPADVTVPLGPETEARLDAAVRVLAGGVRTGLFPHRPGAAGTPAADNCRYCDFDTLCPPERGRLWAAARADERLVDYVTLTEGETDADQGTRDGGREH